jgi:hypothetical protein
MKLVRIISILDKVGVVLEGPLSRFQGYLFSIASHDLYRLQ